VLYKNSRNSQLVVPNNTKATYNRRTFVARKSLLLPAGENLFQRVKKQSLAAQQAGIELIKLSIGQPSGPAIEEACSATAIAVMSREENMHEYQDNDCPGVPNFAKRFVQAHVKTDLKLLDGTVEYLPIPGIKPMLHVLVEALGTWESGRTARVFTMTKPGYPTPADACKPIKGIKQVHLPMDPACGFLFNIHDAEIQALGELAEGDMIMLNFPHNPTGIVATDLFLPYLCAYCAKKGVRIFNDAAYSILSHTHNAATLTDVASRFPCLNWIEAFSASKAGNFTGWRVGAMVGSPEFIGDIKRIKGNTDSGFTAFSAAGILHLFENHRDKIEAVRELYDSRIKLVIRNLIDCGMRLAVEPEAGFFLLFNCPKKAFGQEINDAEQFNALMIQNTGIVGVPFGKWIRYAICAADVHALRDEIRRAFEKAEVSY